MAGQFTLSAWVKPESFSAGAYAYIIAKNDPVTAHQGYAMWIRNNNLSCGVCDNSSCVEKTETNTTLATAHTYHLACSYNPDTDQMKLYVFEEGIGGIGTTTSAITENLVNYDNNLVLGVNSDASSYFDGVMDEVRLYSRALSDQEIWALQSQGATAN